MLRLCTAVLVLAAGCYDAPAPYPLSRTGGGGSVGAGGGSGGGGGDVGDGGVGSSDEDAGGPRFDGGGEHFDGGGPHFDGSAEHFDAIVGTPGVDTPGYDDGDGQR